MADPVAQVPVEAPPASVLDPDFLVKIPTQIIRQTYDRRDTILYALGVGAGQRADHPGDLPFVLEDRLLALPTMAVVLASPGFWQMEPRYGIDWQRVLHAEQSCDFHAPLPVEGAVRGEFSIEAIVDKGPAKGAILRARRLIYDQADNRLLATVRQTSFLRGDGGRGSAGGDIGSLEPVPDRAPDHMVPMTTRPEQALLYRLSGDYNPLHADPAVASAAGFQRPILHGLCTYGLAGRALLAAVCENDPARLASMSCRFTAPVFPGEELEVHIWLAGSDALSFRVMVPARALVVIDRGHARIAPPA